MDRREKNEVTRKLYEKYYDYLLLRASRYIGYHYDLKTIAEDSVQDTFVKFSLLYPKISDHPDFLGWLIKANLNRLDNMLYSEKNHQKHHAYSLDDANTVHVNRDPVDIFNQFEIKLECRECIDEIYEFLMDQEQKLFNDYFVEMRSAQEIADANNTTVSAVKSQIYRLRVKIKKYFSFPLSIFVIFTNFFHF